MRARRFYYFNGLTDVKKHISQVKTLEDLEQFRYDIETSGTNLTCFKIGNPGVFAVECCACDSSFRHVFLTQSAFREFGELSKNEADSYSVLTD